MVGNSNNKVHKKVKVAIAGVGNCASAILQGISFYGNGYDSGHEKGNIGDTPEGLIAYTLGDIRPGDIEFVAAFDVVEAKVGQDLADAIFAKPNNTIKIADVPSMGIKVQKGKVLDGVGRRLNERVKISDSPPVDVSKILKDSG
ncbi:MAG: hypothetical protein WBL64_10425, partial [Nitrososphaeraceae archaeon]